MGSAKIVILGLTNQYEFEDKLLCPSLKGCSKSSILEKHCKLSENLQVSKSMGKEYVKRGKQCLQQKIPRTGASK
jgi:hypothetical protein